MTMDATEQRAREQLCELGRSLFDRGLTAGSSGNLSVQLDDGWLMTPTNVSLGRLDPATLSKIGFDGALLGGQAPTKERPLHTAIYESRGTARAVVHLHSTHSVAVSMLLGVDPANVLPPLTPYQVMKVGRLPLIPYHRPGDPQVAQAVRELAGRHAAVLLANHGPVVSGVSLAAACDAVEELEETAKLFLALDGKAIRTLTEEQIADLRRTFGVNW